MLGIDRNATRHTLFGTCLIEVWKWRFISRTKLTTTLDKQPKLHSNRPAIVFGRYPLGRNGTHIFQISCFYIVEIEVSIQIVVGLVENIERAILLNYDRDEKH